ncbi:MAG: ferredoxin family protein [Methanobacteriaceae archaeon]|nr:ferredoxin family protein [Methanobacteriaceae archaeon]
MKIVIDQEKCTGCGTCIQECPKGPKIWTVNKKNRTANVSNLEYCHLCMICASKCPEGAITVIRDDEDEKKKQNEKDNLRNRH